MTDRASPRSTRARGRAAVSLACLLLPLLVAGCATTGARAPDGVQRGVASWYGGEFHGRKTASGARYDMHAMTAAHRTLPFGTVVEVHDLDNGLSTRVVVTDRGPFAKGRIIDLSYAAARELDMIGPGTARVELRIVSTPSGGRYLVQVGAFRERDRAEALVTRLAGDFPAVILSDALWHRVQVGVFATRAEAERMRERLLAAGFAAWIASTP